MENNASSGTDPADLDERALPAETETDTETDLNFPQDGTSTRTKSVGGRVRLYSESQVYTISRCEEAEPAEGSAATEDGMGDGAPFRGRSQSAPAALWAAKRYGRQLRRMSDEFDTWLDRGDPKRGACPGRDCEDGSPSCGVRKRRRAGSEVGGVGASTPELSPTRPRCLFIPTSREPG